MQLNQPVTDLRREPDGARDRQVLFGETVVVFEDLNGHSFVQADKDGYVGYLPNSALAEVQPATHFVSAPATHVYERPDIKSPDRCSLSFGSRLTALSVSKDFVETALGFVPKTHTRLLDQLYSDPADIAALFLGTPYLWGGNSRFGIDCSGLIQAALIWSGHPCPGDSDQQQRATGNVLPDGTSAQRNDLFFWKGHVALAVDDRTLIHANGWHMAVAYEPIAAAIQRIASQGYGAVTAHKRL
jgi:cell wall-associated NlpC family hydrolase